MSLIARAYAIEQTKRYSRQVLSPHFDYSQIFSFVGLAYLDQVVNIAVVQSNPRTSQRALSNL